MSISRVQGTSHAAAVARPVRHYSPKVKDLAFDAFPNASVSMQVMFGEATAKAFTKTKVNESKKTVTVMVDGRSKQLTRMRTFWKELNVRVKRPKEFGATYKLVVVDRNNKVIAKTSFKNPNPIIMPHPPPPHG